MLILYITMIPLYWDEILCISLCYNSNRGILCYQDSLLHAAPLEIGLPGCDGCVVYAQASIQTVTKAISRVNSLSKARISTISEFEETS